MVATRSGAAVATNTKAADEASSGAAVAAKTRAADEASTRSGENEEETAKTKEAADEASFEDLTERILRRLTEVNTPSDKPGEEAPDDEGEAVPTLRDAQSDSRGFARCSSVRIGPAGPIGSMSSKWGARIFKSGPAKQFSVRLRRLDAGSGPCDTLIIDCNMRPLVWRARARRVEEQSVAETGQEPPSKSHRTPLADVLRFSLHRLSALDIRNGQVKLEFLRALSEVEESRYLPAPAGPLVVLTFGEGGAFTREQFKFLQEMCDRVDKLGQAPRDMRGSEEGAASSPVTLGLADEVERRTGACPPRHVYDTSGTPIQVEWLPQRYSQMGKRRLRLLLAVIALAALVMPMRRLLQWLTSPPIASFAVALQLGLTHLVWEVANWLQVGYAACGRLPSLLGRAVSASSGVGVEVPQPRRPFWRGWEKEE